MPGETTTHYDDVKDLGKLKDKLGKKQSLAPKDVVEDWDKLNPVVQNNSAWNAKIKALAKAKVKVRLSISHWLDLVVEKEKYNKITLVVATWNNKSHDIFRGHQVKAVPAD